MGPYCVIESFELDAGIAGVGVDCAMLELVSGERELHPGESYQRNPGGAPKPFWSTLFSWLIEHGSRHVAFRRKM